MSDNQPILEAIAAVASALTRRDSQLSAISAQIKEGFEQQTKNLKELDELAFRRNEAICAGINALSKQTYERLAAIENLLIMPDGLFSYRKRIEDKLAAIEQKQAENHKCIEEQFEAVAQNALALSTEFKRCAMQAGWQGACKRQRAAPRKRRKP